MQELLFLYYVSNIDGDILLLDSSSYCRRKDVNSMFGSCSCLFGFQDYAYFIHCGRKRRADGPKQPGSLQTISNVTNISQPLSQYYYLMQMKSDAHSTGTFAEPEPTHDPPIKRKLLGLPSRRVLRSTIWFEDDPGFRSYIRQEWLDLLTLAIMLLIPLFLYNFADPIRTQYFPLLQGGQLLMPQYAYPYVDEFVGTELCAALSFGVPFAIMGLCGIFLIGNFWDTNSAVCHLLLSLLPPLPLSLLPQPQPVNTF
jgi:hypothetical protein